MELSNKISAATLARTAVLLLALTNQVLSAMGKPVLPIEPDRGAAGYRWHHHRGRAHQLVEEQQLHRCRRGRRQLHGPAEAEAVIADCPI